MCSDESFSPEATPNQKISKSVAPVWASFYLTSGYAVWLLGREPVIWDKTTSFVLFSAQLVLSWIWLWSFFQVRRMGMCAKIARAGGKAPPNFSDLSLMVALCFCFSAFGCIINFYAISSISSFMMVPTFVLSCMATFSSALYLSSAEEPPLIAAPAPERAGVARTLQKED